MRIAKQRISGLSGNENKLLFQLIRIISAPLSSPTVDWLPRGKIIQDKEFLVIEGAFKNSKHHVILSGWGNAKPITMHGIRQFAKIRNTLNADAAFLWVSENAAMEEFHLASKLGLFLVSARGKIYLGSPICVQHKSVESWAVSLATVPSGNGGYAIVDDFEGFSFQGKPLQNWLSLKSRQLLQQIKKDKVVAWKHRIRKPLTLDYEGSGLEVHGMETWFTCSVRHRLHFPRVDIRDTVYDPAEKAIRSKASISSRLAFHEKVLQSPEGGFEMPPSTKFSRPDLYIYHPISGMSNTGTPKLDSFLKTIHPVIGKVSHGKSKGAFAEKRSPKTPTPS